MMQKEQKLNSWQAISSGTTMTSSVRDILSERVSKLRTDFNLTQDELGKRIKRSQGNIADIEGKRRGVSLDVLVDLSNLFDVHDKLLIGVEHYDNSANILADWLDNFNGESIQQAAAEAEAGQAAFDEANQLYNQIKGDVG